MTYAQRCRRCRRIRFFLGSAAIPTWGPWRLPLIGARTIEETLCATCFASEEKAREREYIRSLQAVQRRAAKGYGPAKPGEDPFRGMK